MHAGPGQIQIGFFSPYLGLPMLWSLYNAIPCYLFLHYCFTSGPSFERACNVLRLLGTLMVAGELQRQRQRQQRLVCLAPLLGTPNAACTDIWHRHLLAHCSSCMLASAPPSPDFLPVSSKPTTSRRPPAPAAALGFVWLSTPNEYDMQLALQLVVGFFGGQAHTAPEIFDLRHVPGVLRQVNLTGGLHVSGTAGWQLRAAAAPVPAWWPLLRSAHCQQAGWPAGASWMHQGRMGMACTRWLVVAITLPPPSSLPFPALPCPHQVTGDPVKYGLPMAASAAMLAWSYLEHGKAYREASVAEQVGGAGCRAAIDAPGASIWPRCA